jgi:hypothetical protein
MNKSVFVLPVCALTASMASVALAETPHADTGAVVAAVQGSAMVTQPDGIVPATQGMNLQPLNRLFVLGESEATLVFADGCEQTFGANAMVTLTDTATCVGTTGVERVATSQAAAGAAAGATGLSTAAIAGGVAVAVGVAAVAANSDDDDNSTPSASGAFSQPGGESSTVSPGLSPQ